MTARFFLFCFFSFLKVRGCLFWWFVVVFVSQRHVQKRGPHCVDMCEGPFTRFRFVLRKTPQKMGRNRCFCLLRACDV